MNATFTRAIGTPKEGMVGRVKTFSEQVSEHIKNCILMGALKPGDPVRECEIANQLGISRGPVREALQKLQQEDLITGEPQKQRFITSLAPVAISDRYTMAGTLEGACIVQSLESFTDERLQKISAILAEMKQISETARGLCDMSDIDEQFHEALLESCKNRLMVETSRSACVPISKFLYTNLWNNLYEPLEFYERHSYVFDIIKKRHVPSIQNALLEHYAETGRRMAYTLEKCA